MEQVFNHDLMLALRLWKSKCEGNKPESHDCNDCELILEEISRRLTFGELDAALIKKLKVDPKLYLSVGLSKAKEIQDETEDPRTKEFGKVAISIIAKALENEQKNDLIKNLKDTKIDGKPS